MRYTKLTIPLLILGGAILCAAAGCEQKVISESYGPMTGPGASPEILTTPDPTPPPGSTAPKKGLLKGIGDFLFGWMKSDKKTAARPQPQPTQTQTYAPIWESINSPEFQSHTSQ
jgi:hypothetical protein